MNKKTAILATEDNLFVDLTFHNFPASFLTEFTEKIVSTYFNGDLNTAIRDLITKATAEENHILACITHIRDSTEA